ncbi:hypothetical protein E3P96_03354 [Wallemia ichthyophaga]|nr:hypothetical protein E3P96_03354 [Wallemia ichthyophaga]
MERPLQPPTLFKPISSVPVTDEQAQILLNAFLDNYKDPMPTKAALERLRAGMLGEDVEYDQYEQDEVHEDYDAGGMAQ